MEMMYRGLLFVMSLGFGIERFLYAKKCWETGVTSRKRVFGNQYSSDASERGVEVTRDGNPGMYKTLMAVWAGMAVLFLFFAFWIGLSFLNPDLLPMDKMIRR